MGPFFLIDMLGLDTVLHVAEYLNESYGDSFYVHKGMQKLVAEGKLGAKSGGEGFYKDGEPQHRGRRRAGRRGARRPVRAQVASSRPARCSRRASRTVREIDLGMMAGAGLDPRRGLFPPFWKADLEGLDTILEKLERYEESHGERFAPPRTLKRLVAQGRLGLKSGQGFYAYPQVEGEGTVKLEKRGEVAIAWLANPPMNAISPQVIEDLGKVWEQVKADDELKAMVVYSSLPVVFSAGADIKAFTGMDEAGGAELINNGHALLRSSAEPGASVLRSPRLVARGTYHLSLYGVAMKYTAEDWMKVIDRYAEDGMDRVYFWLSGHHPSQEISPPVQCGFDQGDEADGGRRAAAHPLLPRPWHQVLHWRRRVRLDRVALPDPGPPRGCRRQGRRTPSQFGPSMPNHPRTVLMRPPGSCSRNRQTTATATMEVMTGR